MFIGHYGVAYAAKAAEPKLPLWILFVAAQFVDIFWALFVLGGVEKVRLNPALASNPLDLYFMPYTHSLLGAFLWGCLALGLVRFLPFFRYSWKSSILVGLAVVSHWFLDLLVHRQDLPLATGWKVGFGLWNLPVVAFALEIFVLGISLALFLKFACPPEHRRRSLILAGALCLFQAAVSFGPHPPKITTMAISLFVVFWTLPLIVFSVYRKGS